MNNPRSCVIRNVRVIDPSSELSKSPVRDIHVEDDRVNLVTEPKESSPPDVVIDGDGRFALPTLVNAHDHLYSHELAQPHPGLDLAEMRRHLDARDPSHTLGVMIRAAWTELAHGIGVIRDLAAPHGLNIAVARLFDRGVLPGPVVVAAGRPIVETGGHCWALGREADGPWDCRKAVREQAKSGARVIKIMASGGLSHFPDEDFRLAQFTMDELAHIVDEAQSLGLATCAHAFGADAVARAVSAGVDAIEHGVEISDDTLQEMKHRGVAYVPTLTNMERVASRDFNELAGNPDRASVLSSGVVEPQHDTFRRAVQIGLRVGIGTDSTGNYLEEALRMESLGMSPAAVVYAATAEGARICGEGEGRIVEGSPATFSLYREDPRVDLEVLTSPDVVIVRGSEFKMDTSWLDSQLSWTIQEA